MSLYSFFSKRRKKRGLVEIAKDRDTLSKEDYIESLVKKGHKRNHIEVIYDNISTHLAFQFSIYPEDDVRVICNLYDLDDIEFIIEVFSKLEIEYPNDNVFEIVEKRHNCFNIEYILDLVKEQEKKTLIIR
jgi:hypothetical protein